MFSLPNNGVSSASSSLYSDEHRRALKSSALVMIVSSVICFLTAWSVYFFAFLLSGFTLFMGICVWNYTSSPLNLQQHHGGGGGGCCFGPPISAFRSLHSMLIVNLVMSVIGVAVSAFSIYYYLTEGSNGYAYIFAGAGVIALITASTITIFVWRGVSHASDLDKELQAIPHNSIYRNATLPVVVSSLPAPTTVAGGGVGSSSQETNSQEMIAYNSIKVQPVYSRA